MIEVYTADDALPQVTGFNEVYPALAQIRTDKPGPRGGALGARLCWNFVTTALLAQGSSWLVLSTSGPKLYTDCKPPTSGLSPEVGTNWRTELCRGEGRRASLDSPCSVERHPVYQGWSTSWPSIDAGRCREHGCFRKRSLGIICLHGSRSLLTFWLKQTPLCDISFSIGLKEWTT